METLDLEQAAKFLKMSEEALRRMAKDGTVPCKKPGKRWVFIKEHLADWVSGRYASRGRELRVIDGGKTTNEDKQCQSINVEKIKHGGLISPTKMGTEYAKHLGLKTNNKPKNYTTD